jgi:photosystem II stability/assembly factor-like uncharacterized protein
MAQWVPQNSGTTKNLNSVYFTDDNIGYAVGDSGTILKTINGGNNWISQNSGTTKNLYSVFFVSGVTGYAVGDSGTIITTSNGGVLWTSQFSGTDVSLCSVYFPATDVGYMCSTNYSFRSILKTTDGGSNWSKLIVDTTQILSLHSLFFTDATTGYVVGDRYVNFHTGAMIYKTEDAGLTWSNVYQGITVDFGTNLKSVFFPCPDTGYALGSSPPSDPGLLMTTDGGINWNQNSYVGWHNPSAYFSSNNIGYVVTTEDGVWKTVDGGINWFLTYSGQNFFRSVFFINDDLGYAVGDTGIILKTINGGGQEGIIDHNQTTNTVAFYPNPSSDKFNIETSIEGYLSIQNLSGQELLNQTIFKPSTQIYITNLPSGVYFMRFMNDKTVQVRKIIKK